LQKSNLEPTKFLLKISIDDRGFLWQFFDTKEKQISFNGKDYGKVPPIKRVYMVGNFSKDTVRGMHYHSEEWKYFIVVKGSVKFVISQTEVISDKTKTFILSDRVPEVLVVPPKNYNGWKALEDNTLLLGISNFSLEETSKDDYRIPPDNFMEIFKVKSR